GGQDGCVGYVVRRGWRSEGRRPPAAAGADDRDRLGDGDVAEGYGQDEVARGVEDVLVEDLRREEEGLVRIDPADEAVHVEAEGEVEGVALENASLDAGRAGEVEEARVDEGIEAALDVVRALEPFVARRAGCPQRIRTVALALAVQGFPLEVGRLGAHDGIVGGQREGE